MWRLSELSHLTRNLLVAQALITGIGPHLDVRSPYLLGRNSPKCLEEQCEKGVQVQRCAISRLSAIFILAIVGGVSAPYRVSMALYRCGSGCIPAQ
jgi:hypothetical protein